MHKYNEADIKPFEFAEINSSHVVGQPKFETFAFKNIDGKPFKDNTASDDSIRKERTFAKQNNFQIDSTVKEKRGIAKQEETDFENRVNAEVEKRVKQAYQDAYAKGLEEGRAKGQEKSEAELAEATAQKLEELTQVIQDVQAQTGNLVDKNRVEVYEFIKRFTKWIVMKEVNEKLYLETLLEKLILELNARKNLTIKVGRANFADMPVIIQSVEQKVGTLSNVRVEIVPEINHPGIILESENGLIDGSLEGVFQNIDKIFDMVVRGE